MAWYGVVWCSVVLCGVAHSGKSLISVFEEFSSSIDETIILAGGTGYWAIILWGLDSSLIVSNF